MQDFPIGTKLGQLTVISAPWKEPGGQRLACICTCGGAHIATVRFFKTGSADKAMCKRCWGLRMLDAKKTGPRRSY